MDWFKLEKRDSKTKARAGIIRTPHGDILTPAFFPVGTQGTVKALLPQQLREIGIQAVLSNTYHLHLRPGEGIVKKAGLLSEYMSWKGPTMTDSGGFQVFSLGVALETNQSKLLREDTEGKARPRLNKITEEGVTFQSHLDGSTHKLTPESSIKIQEDLGADLIVAFDDLESPKYSFDETKKSLELSNRWEERSKKAQKRKDQLLYGVTHGGRFKELRVESAKFVDSNFEAIALGGAHTNKKNMYEVIDWTVENVSDQKPRHQLGVGEIDDIFEIVERGIDTFDCVIATRLGRMGHVFVSPPEGNIENRFRFDITKTSFAKDFGPIDKNCSCMVCQNFTRSYINHLFRSRELLAYTLASFHNVFFTNKLTQDIRSAIFENKFGDLKKKWLRP